MISPHPVAQTEMQVSHSSMHSLVAMLCQPFMEKGKSLCDKFRTTIQRFQMTSGCSVSIHWLLTTMPWKPWRDLQSWCMTSIVLPAKQRPYDAIPPSPPLQYVKRELPIRPAVNGVTQCFPSQKHPVLLSGDGPNRMTFGISSGQTFQLLWRVVKRWQSVNGRNKE